MRVFPVTTAPEELTGDGQAMAWRAGADLVDMEMVQFLRAVLSPPLRGAASRFPSSWAGCGGSGRVAPQQVRESFHEAMGSERMERTTRDVLSIA